MADTLVPVPDEKRLSQFLDYAKALLMMEGSYQDTQSPPNTYYIHKHSVPSALAVAFARFPDIASTYALASDFDYTEGTDMSSTVRAKCPHGVAPHLLTTYLAGTSDSTDKFKASLAARRKIQWEYQPFTPHQVPGSNPVVYDGVTAGAWTVATPGDGMSIDGDGTISLPGLRLAGQTYCVVSDPRIYDNNNGQKITSFQSKWFWLQPIRATLAIYHDSRVTAACCVGNVALNGVAAFSAGGVDSDATTPVIRTIYLDAGNAARLEFRRDGWPDPESVPTANIDVAPTATYSDGGTHGSGTWTYGTPSVAAPDKATVKTALVNDSDWLQSTVERKRQDFGRLDRGGRLELNGIVHGIPVGTQIKSLANVPVRGVVTGISYNFAKPQKTILHTT